ncbi:hypothetical protein R6Q59_031173 [Mikania micrantha]
MDPSSDCMNLDKPPDPNEFPTLEAGAGIGKRSSPRLALNAKSKKQKEVAGTKSSRKDKSAFVDLNLRRFVEEGAIENLGVQGAEALVGIPKLDNGLVMSTVQHAGDVLNSGINQDNSLPISPEQEADPANIVDTDMDAEEEDYSSGEDEEYHEDDDIFGKDEDDSVLDLDASILKGDLVSTGKVSRETNQVYEQVDMEDVNTDNESVDFGITDAQKLAIINRLVKFKSVRAEDQENWEQGEWDFFHHQVKVLKLDPRYSIEDVDLDDSEIAKYFAREMKGRAGSGSENRKPAQNKKV